MMSNKLRGWVLWVAALAAAVTMCVTWQRNTPRTESLQVLTRFSAALQSGDNAALLDAVVIPKALAARTPTEQTEFVRRSMSGEVSAEGLAMLRKRGQFGPVLEVFPQEATNWAAQAGVKPEDCVAFKLERNSLRAEAVLVREPPLRSGRANPPFRIVRCNNVK